jgi:N-acetylglutamate synthase-like GNAT family acetyltransferase
MPQLYIEEYTRALSGKTVCIACREGILRDHFSAVIADIKFLVRQGIATVLYHNLPNRFANQKHFQALENRLPETRIVRLRSEVDFYNQVLDHADKAHKLIFLERKPLQDQQGRVINALTTPGVRQSFADWGEGISNVNFKSVLERICFQIDNGHYDRVHILPAGKNTIKHELFTIEGHGTLIANNFVEQFKPIGAEEEIRLVKGILKRYKHLGYIKPRSDVYLKAHWRNFFVTLIDGIVVGCVEKKIIDPETAEIAALAISTKFRNQRVGVYTVKSFMQAVQTQGYTRVISLTNNPALITLYEKMGFVPCRRDQYPDRQAQSPGVAIFYKDV